MLISIIVPVYNRADEVDELLMSLTLQTRPVGEVIIVEDGSKDCCKHIVDKYVDRLNLHYYFKPNSGPGTTRNYGAQRSAGKYLIFLDSDCILPPQYVEQVEVELAAQDTDAFGGPDRAHESFSDLQKAINYSMTSFFTTGGIRGGKRKMDKFYPRSFNMGIKKMVFDALGGFSELRFGEDIDLSTRIFEGGYACRLFPEAWVYHKRRTKVRAFYKQVYNFGIARITMYKRHPKTMKLVHLLPAVFTVGCAVLLVGGFVCWYAWLLLVLYAAMVLVDATVRCRSLMVGLLAVVTSFVQLLGYGSGFLMAWWKICVLRHTQYIAFQKNFYK